MNKKRWRIPAPDYEWLAEQYLLPLHGKGRSCPDIGKELGVSKYVVQRWVKKMDLWQPANERRVFMRKGNPTWWIQPPKRDELAQKYLLPPEGLGMTLEELTVEYGVSMPTVRKWLKVLNLTQIFVARHSQRMTGKGNPAYINGNSHRYVGRTLAKVKPKVCEWCKTTIKVQIHHVDHNREHNDLDNLMWLCYHCNLLEAHIWKLQQANRIKIEHQENMLTIEFLGDN